MEKELTREWKTATEIHKDQCFDAGMYCHDKEHIEAIYYALSQAYQAGMTEIGRKCLGAVPEKPEANSNDSLATHGTLVGYNKARTAILTVLQDNGVEIKSDGV